MDHPSWCPCIHCQAAIKAQTAKIRAELERMNQVFAVRDVQSLVQEELHRNTRA